MAAGAGDAERRLYLDGVLHQQSGQVPERPSAEERRAPKVSGAGLAERKQSPRTEATEHWSARAPKDCYTYG
jgi:hypothetical protein